MPSWKLPAVCKSNFNLAAWLLLQVIMTWWKCDQNGMWQRHKPMVCTPGLLSTQLNNSLLYAAMVSPLIHPWFHSSWHDWTEKTRQQLVRSLSQPVHWHSKTCKNCMYLPWDTGFVIWWIPLACCEICEIVLHSIPFLNTQSSIWRQFFYCHGSCCWGIDEASPSELRALTFHPGECMSISHSVAIVT